MQVPADGPSIFASWLGVDSRKILPVTCRLAVDYTCLARLRYSGDSVLFHVALIYIASVEVTDDEIMEVCVCWHK